MSQPNAAERPAEGEPDEVPTSEELDVEAPNESAPGHNPDED